MAKRIAFCLVLLVSLTLPASAQLRYGLRLGVGAASEMITELRFNDQQVHTYLMGPMLEFIVPGLGLGVDASVLYSHQDIFLDDYVMVERIKTLQVPIIAKWSFGLGSTLGVFLSLGPQYGFDLGEGSFCDGFEDYWRHVSNWSANIGGGIRFLRHYQVGVNYNLPLSQRTGNSFFEQLSETGVWQLSLVTFF